MSCMTLCVSVPVPTEAYNRYERWSIWGVLQLFCMYQSTLLVVCGFNGFGRTRSRVQDSYLSVTPSDLKETIYIR